MSFLGLASLGVFTSRRLRRWVLVGFFAIFHGHAHGAEMPESASGLAFIGKNREAAGSAEVTDCGILKLLFALPADVSPFGEAEDVFSIDFLPAGFLSLPEARSREGTDEDKQSDQPDHAPSKPCCGIARKWVPVGQAALNITGLGC